MSLKKWVKARRKRACLSRAEACKAREELNTHIALEIMAGQSNLAIQAKFGVTQGVIETAKRVAVGRGWKLPMRNSGIKTATRPSIKADSFYPATDQDAAGDGWEAEVPTRQLVDWPDLPRNAFRDDPRARVADRVAA